MKTILFNFLHLVGLYLKATFLSAFFVFLSILFSLVTKAQSTNTYTPLGKGLQTLPLDTILVKLGSAVQNMDVKNEAQIKQEILTTLARAKATNNPLYIAKANQQLANWHYGSTTSGNKDSIYHYDKQALTYFLQTKENELITRAYRNVGFDFDEMQQFAQAEIYYFKSLKVAQSIGYQSGINAAHAALSTLYILCWLRKYQSCTTESCEQISFGRFTFYGFEFNFKLYNKYITNSQYNHYSKQ